MEDQTKVGKVSSRRREIQKKREVYGRMLIESVDIKWRWTLISFPLASVTRVFVNTSIYQQKKLKSG